MTEEARWWLLSEGYSYQEELDRFEKELPFGRTVSVTPESVEWAQSSYGFDGMRDLVYAWESRNKFNTLN